MRVQDVAVIVREVHAQINPRSIPIGVQAIKNYIADKLGVQFKLFDVASWKSQQLVGRLKRWEIDGKCYAEIVVSSSLNTCWTRYVACKELAHLLIDKSDDEFASDPIKLIRSLIDTEISIEQDVASERWAMFAAIELLIPWNTRGLIFGMIGEGKTNFEIASHYKVPEKVIDTWRSPNYQNLLQRSWEDLESAGN